MAKKIKAKSLYRIGVVVKDADATAAKFAEYFEIDESKKMVVDTSQYKHDDFYHYDRKVDFDMKLIIFPLGGIEIELIEPLDNRGPYAEWLRNHGEGLHHFNIEVDDNKNFQKAMEELNVPLLTGGYLDDLKLGWKYFESYAPFKMVYEICQEEPFEDL